MKTIICSFSGVRGVTGADLTPGIAFTVARLFLDSYLLKNRKNNKPPLVIIGKDPKASGNILVKGLLAGFGDSVKAEYLGTTSTPAVEWAVKRFNADGGIIITASHNPKQWNGIKLISGSRKNHPMLLKPAEMQKICKGLSKFTLVKAPARELPPVKEYAADYFKDILAKVTEIIDECSGIKGTGRSIIKKIGVKNYKVVLDACCGDGAVLSVGILRALGIKEKNIVIINSGKIEESVRPLEPAVENLGNLQYAIKKNNADAGFAIDPDQDRLVAMPLSTEENTPLVAARFLLELQKKSGKKPIKAIAINSSTSRAWEDIAEYYGIRIIRTPVGEVNVAGAMIKRGIIFGAEGNGGVILGSVNYGRNSAVGIPLILAYLAWSGKTLDAINGELPQYHLSKQKIPFHGGNAGEVIKKIAAHFKKDKSVLKIETYDGCKISFRNNSWLQVRASNTEPIIRIFSEAPSEKKALSLFESVKRIIQSGRK